MLLSVPAFAGGMWQQTNGKWWYLNGDGTYEKDCWTWIDGNNDGVAEVYYFDTNGFLEQNSVKNYGESIIEITNDNGALTINNAIVQAPTSGVISPYDYMSYRQAIWAQNQNITNDQAVAYNNYSDYVCALLDQIKNADFENYPDYLTKVAAYENFDFTPYLNSRDITIKYTALVNSWAKPYISQYANEFLAAYGNGDAYTFLASHYKLLSVIWYARESFGEAAEGAN